MLLEWLIGPVTLVAIATVFVLASFLGSIGGPREPDHLPEELPNKLRTTQAAHSNRDPVPDEPVQQSDESNHRRAILEFLGDGSPRTVEEVSEYIKQAPKTVKSELKKLQRDRCVTASAEIGRGARYTITAQGHDKLRRYREEQ